VRRWRCRRPFAAGEEEGKKNRAKKKGKEGEVAVEACDGSCVGSPCALGRREEEGNEKGKRERKETASG